MADGQSNANPRPPRNLQGLLNFCTEITAREDTTKPTDLAQLDPERRAFLEEALTSMTVNVVQKIAEAVKVLYGDKVSNPEESVDEEKEALETISEYVEDLNYAMDLHKMGGFPALLRCLDSPHASLRIDSANVIGEITQNNLYCQSNMMVLNPLPRLLQMMDSDENTQAKVKALFAVSCLVRGYPEGEAKFLELEGFSYLMRAMQSGVEKLVIKSAFFLNALIDSDNVSKDAMTSMGYVVQLISILSDDSVDDTAREKCIMLLSNLAESYPPALADCLRPEFNLRHDLKYRLSKITGRQEHEDEVQYTKTLLQLMEKGIDDDESS